MTFPVPIKTFRIVESVVGSEARNRILALVFALVTAGKFRAWSEACTSLMDR